MDEGGGDIFLVYIVVVFFQLKKNIFPHPRLSPLIHTRNKIFFIKKSHTLGNMTTHGTRPLTPMPIPLCMWGKNDVFDDDDDDDATLYFLAREFQKKLQTSATTPMYFDKSPSELSFASDVCESGRTRSLPWENDEDAMVQDTPLILCVPKKGCRSISPSLASECFAKRKRIRFAD